MKRIFLSFFGYILLTMLILEFAISPYYSVWSNTICTTRSMPITEVW